MAVLTLGLAGALICQSCRSGRMQLRQFTPVIAGVAVMFVGTASAVLPQMVSLPVDTFSCCVNAVCLYYMLCRRRVVQLRSFATDAPVYALSVICSALILANWYQPMQAFLGRLVSGGRQLRTITSALAFSAMTMVICALLRKLMGNLLLKGPEEQEEEIRRFSTAVSKTLQLNELLSLYRDFLQQNLPGLSARVFLRAEDGSYVMQDSTKMELGLPGCVFARTPARQAAAADRAAASPALNLPAPRGLPRHCGRRKRTGSRRWTRRCSSRS